MAIGISSIVIALIGLVYGINKKDKRIIIASIIGLIVIAIIWGVYSYLYSLTPY